MKYQLIMTRDITESAIVVIEANSEQEAKDKAHENRYGHHWETNDSIGDTYCTGISEVTT